MTDKRTEKIKNVLLVVLFLTTILLLYLLWSGDSGTDFSVSELLENESVDTRVPEITDVLSPRYIAFGMGDGSYRLAEGNLTKLNDKALEMVRTSIENSAAVVSTISGEQFETAVSAYNSVLIKCCTALPMTDYAELLGFNNADSLNSISQVSAFAFSEASPESMLVYDGIINKYYRVVFETSLDYVNVIREEADLADSTYYLAGSILGGDSKAFIPLEGSSSLVYSDFENEYEYGGRDLRRSMAEDVFGENFDFVRRITDSFGNITYMYGYGQEVFTAYTDGSFSYTCESENTYSKGFFSDLKLALEFASGLGGWVYDGEESGLVLRDCIDEGTGRVSDRVFCFAQYIDGYEICTEDDWAMEIVVESGQVTGLNRNIVLADKLTYSSENSEELDAPNVIAQNCNHIYNIVNNNTLAAATDEAFNYASEAVTSLSVAMFRHPGDSFLTPCWKVETAGVSFYFDLKTASPLGFRRY